MTELDKRALLEERYMEYHNLEPDYPDDQDEIKEMKAMDDATLEADVKAAEEYYEYISGSFMRKNFGNMGTVVSGPEDK